MDYFLANSAPKIPNYVNCVLLHKILKQKFLIHSACKSSLVLRLIKNYPFSKLKQRKKVTNLAPNKSKQGFLFQAVNGNFFNHDACYIKN